MQDRRQGKALLGGITLAVILLAGIPSLVTVCSGIDLSKYREDIRQRQQTTPTDPFGHEPVSLTPTTRTEPTPEPPPPEPPKPKTPRLLDLQPDERKQALAALRIRWKCLTSEKEGSMPVSVRLVNGSKHHVRGKVRFKALDYAGDLLGEATADLTGELIAPGASAKTVVTLKAWRRVRKIVVVDRDASFYEMAR